MLLDASSRIVMDDVVCVFTSYSIGTFSSLGLNIDSLHTFLHILRPEMFYTREYPERKTPIPHLPSYAASGVISVKIRTSAHSPKYADQGHAQAMTPSRCAPDSPESTAYNEFHQGHAGALTADTVPSVPASRYRRRESHPAFTLCEDQSSLQISTSYCSYVGARLLATSRILTG